MNASISATAPWCASAISDCVPASDTAQSTDADFGIENVKSNPATAFRAPFALSSASIAATASARSVKASSGSSAVVRRWMLRELGPAARAKRFAEEGLEALRNLARLVESPSQPAVALVAQDKGSPFAWFAIGAAVSGLTFLLAAWVF